MLESVCVCVCETVYVYVCVCERERERECVCVCSTMRGLISARCIDVLQIKIGTRRTSARELSHC